MCFGTVRRQVTEFGAPDGGEQPKREARLSRTWQLDETATPRRPHGCPEAACRARARRPARPHATSMSMIERLRARSTALLLIAAIAPAPAPAGAQSTCGAAFRDSLSEHAIRAFD